MFSFSFKNRIAFNYIVSGSFLIAVVFVFIYSVVKYSVNNHINEELISNIKYENKNYPYLKKEYELLKTIEQFE